MAAVLDPVVPNGSPVVHALIDQPVGVLQRFSVCEALSIGVEVFFHDSDGFFTLREAG